MSNGGALGRYHFQAWARRGIGASVNNPDHGSLPDRASLNVQVLLNVQGGQTPNPLLPPPVTVELFGPGDVVGIDPRMVVRTEPRQFTVNFEPNYLCAIDFDTPDFPWLFTPAAPNGDRLRPWVALIALKQEEFALSAGAPNPLPAIDVLDTSSLQDLSESWNWAHVQISGDATLADTLADNPGNVISRLLCPRRLDPESSYSAFLVPAFQIGVQAGLGRDVSGIQTSDPAWTPGGQAQLTLPFYYRFDFGTSDEGDFESLVRRLTPTVLPASVGQRPMDVSQPDPGIPSAGGPLGLPGALEAVAAQSTPWTSAAKDGFQTALQSWINQTSPARDDPANPNRSDPVIVPPIYGRWQAAITSVNRKAAGWENDLNLDPRNRTAAGVGTQIVQGERTQLLASAWQQVDGVLRANQMLKQAQLARAASQQIYRQHLERAQPETLLNLTGPLHARILAGSVTVKATIGASRVPQRMFSGAFRKAALVPQRLGMATPGAPTLVSRVSSGAVSIVPAPAPPRGMVALDKISNQVQFAKFTEAAVAAVPPQPNFQVTAPAPPRPVVVATAPGAAAATPPAARVTAVADSARAAAFRTATEQLFAAFQALPQNPAPSPALEVPTLRSTILTRIDPVTTVPRRIAGLLTISGRLGWRPADPLEPIMAYPRFPQPMYAPLGDLSQQYLLPGVDQIPDNTLGLLVPNHAFIEAYMVGLNHEMARQLLWNGYPTDQRGSYFRQFWDVSAYVPQKTDPTDPSKLQELLKDIPPINTWPLPVPLGKHPNRSDIVANNLVLLVRGELFKRYPSAIVYAGKAKRDATGNRVLDATDERYPLFRGTLSPDMTFLGFNLTAADARGGTAAAPDGFFFVFQQQPSEPRFGLEPNDDVTPVPHWADLAWTNFAARAIAPVPVVAPAPTVAPVPVVARARTVTPAPAVAPAPSLIIANSPWREASLVFAQTLVQTALPSFLPASQQPTGTAIVSDAENPEDANNNWGVNSAQTAYILLRLPFRILIHASLMLPPS
jgi:hypothetical protein